MDVAERVRAYIAEELSPRRRSDLAYDTPLLEGLIDSLEVVQLVMFIEREFEVTLDFAEVTEEHFATVSAIASLVGRKRAAAPGVGM